jgi:tRNA threonylcarbamoyladenosine biosynthesis protein TsaB
LKPLILHIETATFSGSVALSRGDELLDVCFLGEGEKHIKTLAPAVSQLLAKNSISAPELKAVAVSEGPGSYTGLRIGVSFAKGLAMATGCELLSVPTLEVLRNAIFTKYDCDLAIPLLDARRMEVYTAVYSKAALLGETKPLIIEANSFDKYKNQKVVFAGNGSEKCSEVLSDTNWVFDLEIELNAADMISTVWKKFEDGDFADLVEFEPFYLKEFVVGKASKKIADILNS